MVCTECRRRGFCDLPSGRQSNLRRNSSPNDVYLPSPLETRPYLTYHRLFVLTNFRSRALRIGFRIILMCFSRGGGCCWGMVMFFYAGPFVDILFLQQQQYFTQFCSICNNIKPERAHHCRICKRYYSNINYSLLYLLGYRNRSTGLTFVRLHLSI